MAENERVVLAEIHRVVTEQLEWEGAVEPSQHLLKDLQLDSMGLTVLAVELENRFRIRLSLCSDEINGCLLAAGMSSFILCP